MNYLQSPELISAKNREIQCIGSRAAQRIKKIMSVINDTILENITIDNPDMVAFKMSDGTKKKIVSNLMECIKNWNGAPPKMNASRKRKNNPKKKSYKKLRAFWNHKKAEKLGDYLFSVILSLLFQHMVSIPLPNMVLLYIDIFCKLLQETIKYPRTKPLPLICCACFVKQNKFKQFGCTFLKYFGNNIEFLAPVMTKTEKVNGKSQTKYVRDSSRAKKQHALYLECLIKLKGQLETSNNRVMQAKINPFQKWIIEQKTSDRSNSNLNNVNTNQFNVNTHCNNQFIFQSPRIITDVYTQNVGISNMPRRIHPNFAETNVNVSDGDFQSCCCVIDNQFGNINVNYPQMHDQLFNGDNINTPSDDVSNDGSQNSVVTTSTHNGSNLVVNNDNYNFDDSLPPMIDIGFVGSIFDDNVSQNLNSIECDPIFWNEEQYGFNQSQQQQVYI